MNIGEVATPPFAVLPDPSTLFARRSRRFGQLAPGNEIGAYLNFLAQLTRAQHDVQTGLATPALPSAERLARAQANSMPPIAFGPVEIDNLCEATFSGIARLIEGGDLTPASQDAVARVLGASSDERRGMMTSVLLDAVPEDRIAEHVLAAAALQVHFARIACQLEMDSLQRIADHACPACGSRPVASAIVGWEGAHGTRFCTCSLCATQWHVVRATCVMCDNERGIAYRSIEGQSGLISGETCDSCRSYVKTLHQHKDPTLDPVADDVATLALDMTLSREGWQRASENPFLLGY